MIRSLKAFLQHRRPTYLGFIIATFVLPASGFVAVLGLTTWAATEVVAQLDLHISLAATTLPVLSSIPHEALFTTSTYDTVTRSVIINVVFP